jgi:ABC-2 type transport system ATP-binding protein
VRIAVQTEGLGKRYGRTWALRDCSLELPSGRIGALVGPNGAGKTTLLQLAVGLTSPSSGSIRIFGASPQSEPSQVLPRIGFVAQDQPLYRRFSVADMLTLGRKLNSRWDDGVARSRLAKLGIPLNRMVGTLSGGQRSQVALVMALAKRPDVLLLDEPVASLDPLARREFLQTLMEAAAESGLTVLLSSHIVADLERVCDYLIILSASHVQLTGDIDRLVETHKLLVSTRRDSAAITHIHNVIQERHTDRQTTLLVRTNGHIWDPSWEVHDLPLEDIVLAYLSQATDSPQVLSGVTREVLSA